MIALTRGALGETFRIIKRDAEKYGLIINEGKTEYMRNIRNMIKRRDCSINNMKFEHVSSF
jgi:hypothetical protein